MNKDNKKILIRGLVLSVVLFAVFYGLNYISRMAVLNERYEVIKQVDYMPNESIDVLIVGNSHAQEGINSRLMSDVLDKKVVNFSFSQQQTATVYYFLKKNFKTQSPKVVVLEAYTLIQEVQGGYEFIPLTPAKLNHLIMLGEEGSFIDSFFPIARNHNFWAKANPFEPFIKNSGAGKTEVTPFFSARIMSEIAITRHINYDSQKNARKLYDYRLEHLDKILELCKENDAELIITMLPLYNTLVDRIDYDELYYAPIKTYCEANEIAYYDMNRNSSTEWSYKYFREQDYTQNTHLNVYGQTLASIELAEYLAQSSKYFSITEYEEPNIRIADYLNSIDHSNDFLIIDDCPNSINIQINPEVVEMLKYLGISLKAKVQNKKQENDEPDIYFVSDGVVYYDYILLEGLSFAEDGVTIYELDDNGVPVKHAVSRWDEFDIVIIR